MITMLLQLAEWPPSGRKMALSMLALDLIQVTPVVASNQGELAWLPSFAYMAAAFAGLLVGTLPTLLPWPRLALSELRVRQEYAVRALAQCVEVLLEGLSGNAAARLPVLQEHVSVLLGKVRSNLVVSRERLAEARWGPARSLSLAVAEDHLAYLDDAAVSVEVLREIYRHCDFSLPAHDRLMGLARDEARSLQTALVRALWLLGAGRGRPRVLLRVLEHTRLIPADSAASPEAAAAAAAAIAAAAGGTRGAAVASRAMGAMGVKDASWSPRDRAEALAEAECCEALAELRSARATFEQAYFDARFKLYYEGHDVATDAVMAAARAAGDSQSPSLGELPIDPRASLQLNASLFELSTLCNGVCGRLALRSALLRARLRDRGRSVPDLETGDESVNAVRRSAALTAALAGRSIKPQSAWERLRALAGDVLPGPGPDCRQLSACLLRGGGAAGPAAQARLLAAFKTSLAMTLAAVYGFYVTPDSPAALPAWTVAWISADSYAGANILATSSRALATVIAAAWAQVIASWSVDLKLSDQLLVAAIALVIITVPASYVRGSPDPHIAFVGLNTQFTAALLLAGASEGGLAGQAQQRITLTVVGSICLLLVELLVFRVSTDSVLLGSVSDAVHSLHEDIKLFLGLFSGLANYVAAEVGDDAGQSLRRCAVDAETAAARKELAGLHASPDVTDDSHVVVRRYSASLAGTEQAGMLGIVVPQRDGGAQGPATAATTAGEGAGKGARAGAERTATAASETAAEKREQDVGKLVGAPESRQAESTASPTPEPQRPPTGGSGAGAHDQGDESSDRAALLEAIYAAHSALPLRVAPFARRQARLARQRALLAHRAVEPVITRLPSSDKALQMLVDEESRMLRLGLQLARIVRQACSEILGVGDFDAVALKRTRSTGASALGCPDAPTTGTPPPRFDRAFTLLLAPVAREIIDLIPMLEAVVDEAAAVQRLGLPLPIVSERQQEQDRRRQEVEAQHEKLGEPASAPGNNEPRRRKVGFNVSWRLARPVKQGPELSRPGTAKPMRTASTAQLRAMQIAPAVKELLLKRFNETTRALQDNVRLRLLATGYHNPSEEMPSNTEIKFVAALVFALSELIDSLDRFAHLTANAQAERVLLYTQRPYEISCSTIRQSWVDLIGHVPVHSIE